MAGARVADLRLSAGSEGKPITALGSRLDWAGAEMVSAPLSYW